MEEWIGAWWDKLITKATQRTYPQAAVSLQTIARALALFYRGCGGLPSRTIKPSPRWHAHHRRTLLERIAGVGDRYTPAALSEEDLYLPATINWFPTPQLNREAYFWLTLAAAHYVPSGEPIWLANQRATVVALSRFPAWEKRYRRLVDALVLHRPDPHRLPPAEAAVERAIRQALIHPGTCLTLPDGATRPWQPVLLWLTEITTPAPQKKVHRRSSGPTQRAQLTTERTFTAQRTAPPDQPHGMLLIFRAESLLSWAEYVKVNRSQDDDPETDPGRAADSLDELHFASDQESVASRVRLTVDTAPGAEDLEAGAEGALFPEWDYRTAAYRQGYCRVQSLPAPSPQDTIPLPEHLRPLIRRVRAQLALLAPVRVTLRGLNEGAEIDLDRFVRFHSERRSGGAEGNRGLYEEKRARVRDIATVLLADTSLSTDAHASDTKRVIDVIREALWVFTEAIHETGDDLALATFSSYRRQQVTLQWLKTFAMRDRNAICQQIGSIRPGYYTRLGAAIRGATEVLRRRPNSLKLLFLLSDGKPHDLDGYEGRYAIEDSRMALHEARRAGIRPFCLTIDQEAAEYLPYLFGQNGFTLIPRILTLAERLPAIYAHLTQGL